MKKKKNIKLIIGMIVYLGFTIFHSTIANLITLEDLHIPFLKSISNFLSWVILNVGLIGLLLSGFFLYRNNKKEANEESKDE